MADQKFHHITKAERKQAISLWNKFNEDLGKLGMTLHYNYEWGNFFVADKSLEPANLKRASDWDDPVPEDERTLTGKELSEVMEEGGFGRTAVNNPPWFATTSHYSLKVPEPTVKARKTTKKITGKAR